jgi:SNF2 family DNA or RNA helicase
VKDADFLSRHDVVISTFSTMAYEHRQGNSTLHMVHWRRIILDEAHVIKERKTSQAQAAFDLRGSRRWCLSATPIQNKIDDLFSLVCFIGIPPFNDYKWWDMEVRKQAERGQMKKIQTLVKAITLRRMKNQKLNGKPVVDLPAKKDNVWYIELTDRERKQYELFHGDAKEALRQVYRRGKGFENGGYAMMFEKMLRLRQICVHPALLPRKEVSDSSPENVLGTPGSFSQAKANDIYRLMKESGDDNCNNCLIEFSEQDEGNEENFPVVLECGRLLCVACFNSLSSSGKACETCTEALSLHNKYSITKWKTSDEPSSEMFDFFGGYVESPETAESIINITENTGPLGPEEMSSKFKALIEDLMGHVAKGTKSVVFSQWTSSLSLLEPHLKSFRINYLRFDGKMTLQERRKVLDKFRDSESNCFVLLVSLRAGGVGLNLTVASRVYLIDPWFNFSVENQAIERVYRIGQTKEVETVRLVIKNSIEEKIIEIQEKKAKMAREALMDRNTGGTKHEKSLRGEDIEFLLK